MKIIRSLLAALRRRMRCTGGEHREVLGTGCYLEYTCLDCQQRRRLGQVWFGASNHRTRRVA